MEPNNTNIPEHPDGLIDSLNQKIYSKDEHQVRKMRPGVLHEKKYDVEKFWKAEKKPETPMNTKPKNSSSLFKKFFIFSIICFIGAILFAGYSFFAGSNTVSNENISIAISSNPFTAGGEELPLSILVTNNNSIDLESVNLLIEYPKGSGAVTDTDVNRIRKVVGVIKSGDEYTENMKVILFGEEGDVKDIKATLEYRIKGSNAIFIKDTKYEVRINSAPLALSVSAPKEISSNQNLSLAFKVTQNSQKSADKMILRVDYPPGFEFASAVPKPILGNNVFALGDLKQGSDKTITIQGVMYGEDAEERSFHAYVGTQNPNDQAQVAVQFNSLIHTITIKKPFVEAHLVINGEDKDEYFVPQTGTIRGEVSWKNNLSVAVTDLEISAKFSGVAFNESSVTPLSGFYNSSTDTIVWDKNSVSALSTVTPGESGKLSFTFTPKQLYGGGSIISNPQIVIELSIKGKQPSEGNILSAVSNSESKTIKISTDFQIAGQALYFNGAFVNSGPMPPQAEHETTYTIKWNVTNSANKIVNAKAVTNLPLFVDWVGTISPATEHVTYDPTTREITWDIGTVMPGTGLTGTGKEVSFQVKLKPSLTQVGQSPMLIDKTTLSGQDSYTGSMIKIVKGVLNTRLSNDSGFLNGMEKVVQ